MLESRTYFVVGAIAYLIGSFPTGVVLTKRRYGIDVREMGSGNIGATNVTRVFGWHAGILVFVIDFLKGFVPLLFLQKVYPLEPWMQTTVGTCLVAGHCFSVFLKFRGGKGVATSLGCLTVTLPWLSAIGVALYGTVVALTRISAVGSLSGMALAILYVWIMRPPAHLAALVYAITFFVLLRHHANIRRLWQDIKAKRSQGIKAKRSKS